MICLIRRVVAVWLSSVIVIGFALLIGRRQPLSEAMRQLHLADCAPACWIGIIPGRTRWTEAQQRFEQVFGTPIPLETFPDIATTLTPLIGPNNDQYKLLPGVADALTSDRIIPIVFLPSRDTRYGILAGDIQIPAIDRDNLMPSLGDVVSLLGAPACASIYSPASLVLIYITQYGNVYVTVKDHPVFQWTDQVHVLRLAEPYNACAPPTFDYGDRPWIGLASRERYQRKP
jgi:hypothetical protein